MKDEHPGLIETSLDRTIMDTITRELTHCQSVLRMGGGDSISPFDPLVHLAMR